MSSLVFHFSASIPAGTSKASPYTQACTIQPCIVTKVDWRVPAGPSGLMGWYLAMGSVQVFPVPPSGPIIANGETGTWDVTDSPDGGTWQIVGYNTGTHAHTVYVVFYADPLPAKPAVRPAQPSLAAIVAPDLSRAGPPVGRRP